MKINHKAFGLLLFLTAVGTCCGAFFEILLTGDGKDILRSAVFHFFSEENGSSPSSLSVGHFLELWWKAFRPDFFFLLAAYLSPVIFILLPLLPCYLFYNGMSLGFSAAMTIEILGLRGSSRLLAALLPHNLIQLPLLCVLTVFSFSASRITIPAVFHSHSNSRVCRNKTALRDYARQYSFYYFIGMILFMLSCFLEVCLPV